MLRRAVPLLLLPVLLLGCSAAPPDDAPAPPEGSVGPGATALAAERTVSLADLGLSHGPAAEVTLPADVTVLERVDQPEVLTLVLAAEDGVPSAAHLAATLPGLGYRVTGFTAGNLTFTGTEWDGALTTAPEVSGLTLRAVG